MKGEGIRWVPAGLGFGGRAWVVDGRGLDARDTLILAFSHEGRRDPLASGGRLGSGGGLGWSTGRGLDARDTLILAFSHQGRRDPMGSGGAWFRGAGLAVADAG